MNAALFFDLDGTLIDSDGDHFRAFQRVFAPLGIALTRADYDARILGSDNAAIGRAFLSHLGPAEREATLNAKEASYRDHLRPTAPIAGVGAILDFAEANGLGLGVVTNAPRANVECALAALGLAGRLTQWVVGGDVARPKPDPAAYRAALRRLGADPERSLAFEDSRSGVAAARDAGLAVIGMTTTLDGATLLDAGATLAVADFTDRRILPLIERRAALARRRA
jgi:HAD superfamily hydrolase (TIGR01509 family)